MVLDLKVDGATHLAIPREIQRDHIHGRYIHIDFLAVRRDERITLAVEVYAIGEAPGVKAGGVIEHHLRDVEIETLPSDIPERLELDVSALEIGDMLRVSDIVPPEGVVILSDPVTPVISVDHAGGAPHRGRPHAARRGGRGGAGRGGARRGGCARRRRARRGRAAGITPTDGLARRRPRQSGRRVLAVSSQHRAACRRRARRRGGRPAQEGPVPAGRRRRDPDRGRARLARDVARTS